MYPKCVFFVFPPPPLPFFSSLFLGGMRELSIHQLFVCSVTVRHRTLMWKEMTPVPVTSSLQETWWAVLLLGHRSLTEQLTNGKLLPFYHSFWDKAEHISHIYTFYRYVWGEKHFPWGNLKQLSLGKMKLWWGCKMSAHYLFWMTIMLLSFDLVNEQCSSRCRSGCISTLGTARSAAQVTHMRTHLDQLVVGLCNDDLQTPLSQQHQVAVRVLRHLGTVHVLEPWRHLLAPGTTVKQK